MAAAAGSADQSEEEWGLCLVYVQPYDLDGNLGPIMGSFKPIQLFAYLDSGADHTSIQYSKIKESELVPFVVRLVKYPRFNYALKKVFRALDKTKMPTGKQFLQKKFVKHFHLQPDLQDDVLRVRTASGHYLYFCGEIKFRASFYKSSPDAPHVPLEPCLIPDADFTVKIVDSKRRWTNGDIIVGKDTRLPGGASVLRTLLRLL